MTHVEYPKWLHFAGENSVLVHDATEEAALLTARGEYLDTGGDAPLSRRVVGAALVKGYEAHLSDLSDYELLAKYHELVGAPDEQVTQPAPRKPGRPRKVAAS